MAKGSEIDNPYLVSVIKARQINQQVGGFMVAPWDVDSLPEDWLMVFDKLSNDYPDMVKNQAAVSAKLAELRKRYVQ